MRQDSRLMKVGAPIAAKAEALRHEPKCTLCGLIFSRVAPGFLCELDRWPRASRNEMRLLSEGGLVPVRSDGGAGSQRRAAPCRLPAIRNAALAATYGGIGRPARRGRSRRARLEAISHDRRAFRTPWRLVAVHSFGHPNAARLALVQQTVASTP
jgi:hypothetical protein